MWMKTFRHSKIASATGENIRQASLQIHFDATNTSKLPCTGSRQKARVKLEFQENRSFYLSKLTWLRNRRNTSLTQSSDLLSRCMVRNYVSDFLSIRDYLPHCLSSVKLRCILSGVWRDTVDRKYVMIMSPQIWAWARLSPQGKLPKGYLPRKFHNTSDQIFFFWCTLFSDHISDFTAKSWTFYDIISVVSASLDIQFAFLC